MPPLPKPVTTGSVSPVGLAEASRFWFQLGWVSFGGPAGQIALLHRELVDRRRWLSERRYLHALNYCMLLPGPEAMQLATYLGWLMHGVPGGLIAGGLFVIPSVFVLTALASIYALWGQLPLLASVFAVLKPAVLAIVLMAAWRIGRRTLHTPLLVALAVAGFLALAAFKLPYPVVVISAGLIGLGAARWRPNLLVASKPHGDGSSDPNQDRPGALHDDDSASPDHARFSKRRLAVTLLVWALALLLPLAALAIAVGWSGTLALMARFFTRVALLSFGGAYAVLPYVAQGAVEQFNWLSAPQMLDGLALGETTPGPLIMVVAFVGFMGGWNQSIAAGLEPLAPGPGGGAGDCVVHLPALLRFHPSRGTSGGSHARRPALRGAAERHHRRGGGGDRQPGAVLRRPGALARRRLQSLGGAGGGCRLVCPAAAALECVAGDRCSGGRWCTAGRGGSALKLIARTDNKARSVGPGHLLAQPAAGGVGVGVPKDLEGQGGTVLPLPLRMAW